MSKAAALSFFAAACFAAVPAAAQTGSGPSSSAPTDQTLSHKLSRSNGVLKPPTDVDPGIQKAAPEPHPNSTPVIPPSTSGAQAK